ncbi:hypothetical protein [Dyella terrae]|uniref:hypothetical protein n=1 Tax=Dyella terrae TaxID=522259 RepID=UPI001EFD0CBE|nr:hypothetical protein [Dyella terrae]ULU27695.1 hypothetical protein DYST_04661 [Dyella terrae]
MSLARTNRNVVEKLRESLDVAAAHAALGRGEITPVQARNIIKWITAVKEIRENPLYAIQDDSGRCVGEVTAKDGGRSWMARKYGEGRSDVVEFFSPEDAVAFVRSQSTVALDTMN